MILWSHPACNTVMLCGCCVCLAAAVALGVDGRWVQATAFPGLCAARAWLLATGFSMAYGAMFTKVWRVHRHTTKPKAEPKTASKGVSKTVTAKYNYIAFIEDENYQMFFSSNFEISYKTNGLSFPLLSHGYVNYLNFPT